MIMVAGCIANLEELIAKANPEGRLPATVDGDLRTRQVKTLD